MDSKRQVCSHKRDDGYFPSPGSGSRIPASFSQTRIPHPALLSLLSRISFSFPIPKPCPNFGKSCFLGSSQIPYPVNVSRIPHCVLAKSRIPKIPFRAMFKMRIHFANNSFLNKTNHDTNLLLMKTDDLTVKD